LRSVSRERGPGSDEAGASDGARGADGLSPGCPALFCCRSF
jgi:hypothetical protein